MPNLLSIAEARPLVDTQLSDADLTTVITREESWLARQIDALAGPRTQYFWVGPAQADSSLWLRRPVDPAGLTTSPPTVVVVDGGITLNAVNLRILARGTTIERVLGYWLGTTDRQLGPVAVTYTPNDTDEVKRVLIDLVRLTLSAGPYQSEQIGQYQYTRSEALDVTRTKMARSLLAHHGAKTMQLRSSVRPDRVAARTWSSWWP